MIRRKEYKVNASSLTLQRLKRKERREARRKMIKRRIGIGKEKREKKMEKQENEKEDEKGKK